MTRISRKRGPRLSPGTFVFDLGRKALLGRSHPLHLTTPPRPGDISVSGLDGLSETPWLPVTRGSREGQGLCRLGSQQWPEKDCLLVFSPDLGLPEGQGLWLLHVTGMSSTFVV